MSVFVPENASEEVRKDVERAREAIGTEIASSSAMGYLRCWRRFASYCARNEMDFFPAKVDTAIPTLRCSMPELRFVISIN